MFVTHASRTVQDALRLAAEGRTTTDVANLIQVPRRTVSDWLRGRVPGSRAGSADCCATCGQAVHDPGDLPLDYVYLLGAYLGDGCLSPHPREVFKLRIVLDAVYPRIIDEVAAAMQAVRPENSVGRVVTYNTDPAGDDYESSVEVFSYSRAWPCLFPQHGPGRKHERPIVLTDWQQALVVRAPERLVRGLIHSDGCRFLNTGRGGWASPRYSFSNVSADIRGIFKNACELLGLHTTEAPPKTVYVSRKADVARMDEFVGPKA